MPEEEEWAAYLYPGTDILRNKLDLRDERALEAERFLARRRADQVRAGLIEIPRTYDLSHYLAIHKALFQDVWDWAGEIRTVTTAKKVDEREQARWFIGPKQIEAGAAGLTEHIQGIAWAELDREGFVEAIADTATWLNFLHPSREGNGRASRIFLEHVAEKSKFQLDFDAVEQREWNEASRDSIKPGRGPHPGGPLVMRSMWQVFDRIVVERDVTAPGGPASHAASVARAGNPLSPRAAVTARQQPQRRAGPRDAPEPPRELDR
ncbi:Fic family protein [Leifsonia sp. H3M29-4]|jgi:cell filamentation protein|uniref:Fic/DOC family protein n=1 Tax=Salinibacterium metalliresistens TaxID=3031321 RepID=UPI0023DAC2F9|nr:Fic family protein [Salinibacterium metalliresistens]MDF1480359.1 Fic family protein [Salinibacterium metalliresistens]